MHEMSLVQGLLDIIEQEMERHGATRLIKVRVRHGALAAVVPEAMLFAWEAITKATPLDGAVLEMDEVPVVLKCSMCGREFQPDGLTPHGMLCVPCPGCGEELGHQVLDGKELTLEQLEVE